MGSATAQRTTHSPPRLGITVPLSHMGASTSNPAAGINLDPALALPSPNRKPGSRVRPSGAAYLVRLTKTVAGGGSGGGSPFQELQQHQQQQQRPGSSPLPGRQQRQRPGSSLPAVPGQQLLPISEDARSGRLHGGTLSTGGGSGGRALSARQQRPHQRSSSGADSSAWVAAPALVSRPGAAYSPRKASDAEDLSSDAPRLSSSGGGGGAGGGSPSHRRSLGLLQSTEESKTLKELSDAYSQAEQLTQELLAQAQRLLYTPPTASGSRPSSGRSAAAMGGSGGGGIPRPLSRAGSGVSGRLSTGGVGVLSSQASPAAAAALSLPPKPSPLQRSSSDAAAALPLTSSAAAAAALPVIASEPAKRSSGSGSASRPASAASKMMAAGGDSSPIALAAVAGGAVLSRPGSGKAVSVAAEVAAAQSKPASGAGSPAGGTAAAAAARSRPNSGTAASAVVTPLSAVVPASTSAPTEAAVALIRSRPNSGTTTALAVPASASASMLTMDEAALLSEALGEPPSPSSTAAAEAGQQQPQQVSA